MSESWDKMRKAKEDEYFEKKNREALERLSKNKQSAEGERRSPVTGEPMEKVIVHGVVIDRCRATGGIWLDAGELEQIVQSSKDEENTQGSGWISSFFNSLTGK